MTFYGVHKIGGTPLSAKERKAVSDRMKKYWAARKKKEKGKVKGKAKPKKK